MFDKRSGVLDEFGSGSNLVVRGPLLNVWRAATDNDGIRLRPEERNRQKNTSVVETVHRASGRERWNDFVHTHRYTLSDNGELHVENVVRLGKEIRDIPRVGVAMILVPGLEQLEWFGRGPWENYSDRKASAMVGRYTSTVTEQYVPYIMPQEHGHITDVRWLSLANDEGRGLRIEGEPTIEFSTSHFSAADLFGARHTIDLTPRAEVILNIDGAHRGLGTGTCGPDTLDQYRLLEPVYRFAFRLRPV